MVPKTPAVNIALISVAVALSFGKIGMALPTFVGGGRFFQAAGASPDAFFQKATAWEPGSVIPGKWTKVSENLDTWKTPETAFGLVADMISLRRETGGSLAEVILTYSTDTTEKSSTGLHEGLQRLLNVMDSDPEKNKDGSLAFESGYLRILLPAKAASTLNLSITRIDPADTEGKKADSSAPGWLVPGDLTDPSVWDSPEFRAGWQLPQGGNSLLSRANHPDPPAVGGLPVNFAEAVVSDGSIRSLSLVLLDAGAHFGYAQTSSGITRDAAADFDRIFADTLTAATGAVSALTGDPGIRAELGSRNRLELPVTLFSGNGIHSRLISLEHQSIILEFFRTEKDAAAVFPERPAVATEDTTETEPLFPDDVGTKTMPVIPQGNRAYCGPAALSMIGHHIGLNLGTESIAGLAGFAYGSSQNGDIRKLASLMAKEAGLKASRSGSFDSRKAAESFAQGLPVLVFRRWSAERDFIHQTIATKLAAGDLTAILPEPGFADADTWPDKSAPAHASVVHGYNPVRKEVIFTETWGTRSAGKRMRIEELEETAYYAVYFRR